MSRHTVYTATWGRWFLPIVASFEVEPHPDVQMNLWSQLPPPTGQGEAQTKQPQWTHLHDMEKQFCSDY